MKPRDRIGGAFYSAFLLLTAFCLAGCKTVGNSGQKESTANLHVQKSHVLFRVVCIDDTTNQLQSNCKVQVTLWRLGDADGKVAALPKSFSPEKLDLSKSSTDQGWKDIAVEPGTYCVQILPIARGASIIHDETNRPVYYLKVSANQSVAYAGTLVLSRDVKKHKGFLESTKSTEFCLKDFRDENEAARQLAGKELAGLGEVTPCLLIPYDTPFKSQQPGLAQVRSGSVATPTIRGNKTYMQSVGDSPFMAPGEVMLGIAGNSGEAGIYVAGAGAALILVAAPIALTTEAVKTHSNHKKWVPIQAALQNEIATFHLDERLRAQLATRMGAGTNSVQAYWMQIQPYRVVLRGNEHQKFALEVAVRVQLFDSATGAPIWEHSYVNAAKDSPVEFELCETRVSSSLSVRRLEDFSGDSGSELMRVELQSAVEDLTREIATKISAPRPVDFANRASL
jgi:hypothetical protein